MIRPDLTLCLALFLATPAAAQIPDPAAKWNAVEADHTVRDFAFASGERLPELRLHYMTLGTPRRDAGGRVTNAVMVLHGTGGSGRQFLQTQFADALFAAGKPLDLAKTFVILPDGIGHGRSSKPSDGRRARFPRYAYADMVRAQHLLLTDGLKLDRLKLLMGTSMGCMHGFMWGTTYPGFAERLMPMACLTVEIAGRNRTWRKLAMDAIRSDPAWAGGDYTAQPVAGLRTAISLSMLAGSVPVRQQADAGTAALADAAVAARMTADLARADANDQLYAIDASRDYNPSASLAKITVPVAWINSADDFINPPGLGIAEREVRKMPRATFRLLPETATGRGHSSHTWAELWMGDLERLLATK